MSIDLGRKRDDTATGLALKWIINSGKIIIVVVELLTLGALAFRFFVDRQIIDLNDKIKQEQLFVNAQQKKETLYRNLQARLSAISTVSTSSQKYVSFINDLTILLNSNEFLESNLIATADTISIDAQAYSVFTVNSLIETLKKNSIVTNISLDELASQDQGVHFKLSAKVQRPEAKL